MGNDPINLPKTTSATQLNLGVAKSDGSNATSPVFFAKEDGFLRVVCNDDVVRFLKTEGGEKINIQD